MRPLTASRLAIGAGALLIMGGIGLTIAMSMQSWDPALTRDDMRVIYAVLGAGPMVAGMTLMLLGRRRRVHCAPFVTRDS